jgi:hypothetical protein
MFQESPDPNLILTVRLKSPAYGPIVKPFRLTIYGLECGKDAGGSIRQFLGVGQCLVLTLKHPSTKPSLLKLSMDLPEIVWLGMTHGRNMENCVEFKIPPQIWHPTTSQYSGEHYVRGYGKNFQQGNGNPHYTLLFLPSFDKSGLILPDYKIPEV